jgi:ribosomal protein S12 methylthiotransferase accessory factor
MQWKSSSWNLRSQNVSRLTDMQLDLDQQSQNVQSIHLFEAELKKLGLNAQTLALGNCMSTQRCFLYNQHGRQVASGAGKGPAQQSSVSSRYEALERYFSQIDFLSDEISYFRIQDIPNIQLLEREKVIQLMLDYAYDERIPCRKYTSINDGSVIYYPLFLSLTSYVHTPLAEDTFNYRRISRYSTNSGTAIGTSFDQALTHAISELLERDALSMFLLQTFIANPGRPIRLINKSTLPPHLQQLVAHLEHVRRDELQLIDLTSDFRLPAIAARFTAQSGPVTPLGTAAASSPAVAIEQAILELIQQLHLQTMESKARDQRILDQLANLGRYQQCASFDLQPHIQSGQIINVDYRQLPAPATAPEPSHAAADLCDLVAANQHQVYYATNYVAESGITCLHALIPGIERFQLVRSGQAILPSDRGIMHLNAIDP